MLLLLAPLQCSLLLLLLLRGQLLAGGLVEARLPPQLPVVAAGFAPRPPPVAALAAAQLAPH